MAGPTHKTQKHSSLALPKHEPAAKDRPDQCPACDYSTPNANLKLHIRNCHLQEKVFSCDECSYIAKLRHHLDKHKRNVHRKEGEGEVVCRSCRRAFRDTSNYVRHMRSVHLQVRRYRCDECGTEFTRKHSFRRHMREAKKCKKQRQTVVKVEMHD